MILQVQDILKDAMGLIGVIDIDEAPSSSEMALALRTANVMIDRWSSQRLLLRSTTPLTVTITSGKSVYTIATSGADVTAVKPISILSGYYRDSGGNDYNLNVISVETYNSLEDKSLSNGMPIYIAYDPGTSQQTVGTGKLYVYYTPNGAYTMYLEVDNYLTEFVNITDTISFEPAYYEALIYNLAIRLFRYHHGNKAAIPQDIVAIAGNSIDNLKNINSVIPLATIDFAKKYSDYNIISDSWT